MGKGKAMKRGQGKALRVNLLPHAVERRVAPESSQLWLGAVMALGLDMLVDFDIQFS